MVNYIYEQTIHKLLVETRGNKCERCGAHGKELVKHHVDGNRSNWEPSNLKLFCKSCNREMHLAKLQESPKEKEKEIEAVRSEMAKAGSLERLASPLEVAEEKYPIWWGWVVENANRESGITMFEAIYEAAEAVGLKPPTTRRYLYMKIAARKLTLGPGPRGHKRITIPDEMP